MPFQYFWSYCTVLYWSQRCSSVWLGVEFSPLILCWAVQTCISLMCEIHPAYWRWRTSLSSTHRSMAWTSLDYLMTALLQPSSVLTHHPRFELEHSMWYLTWHFCYSLREFSIFHSESDPFSSPSKRTYWCLETYIWRSTLWSKPWGPFWCWDPPQVAQPLSRLQCHHKTLTLLQREEETVFLPVHPWERSLRKQTIVIQDSREILPPLLRGVLANTRILQVLRIEQGYFPALQYWGEIILALYLWFQYSLWGSYWVQYWQHQSQHRPYHPHRLIKQTQIYFASLCQTYL